MGDADRNRSGAGEVLPARWAIVCFGVAALSTSATDFGFLVLVMLAWAAFVLPRSKSQVAYSEMQGHRRAVRIGQVLAGAVIGAAFLSMTVAMHAYQDAREAVDRGDLGDAEAAVSRAISADPGMGLYWRQRGALRLIRGNVDGALADLDKSVQINPYDDQGWSALAAAHLSQEDISAAESAIANAVELQRSDPTNLLMMSRIANEAGDRIASREALAEVVQAWPAVTGAPSWSDSIPDGTSTTSIIADAAARWGRGDRSPQPVVDQIMWLAAMGAPVSQPDSAPGNALGPELTSATLSVLQCRSDADEMLARVPSPNAALRLLGAGAGPRITN